MRFGRLLALALVLTSVATMTGCGSQTQSAPQRTPISGIVTLNDKPLADAEVYLHRQGETAEGYVAPAGKTDSSGRYELIDDKQLGVISGKYKVVVRGNDVPKKYTERGSSDIAIDLSDPKRVTGYDIKLENDA